MIKITQLLTESFGTYKKNFKNIFLLALPVLALVMVASVFSGRINVLMTTMKESANYSGAALGTLSGLAFMYFLVLLIVGLIATPAFNRAIQKHEDNGGFSIKDGYSFAFRNIWKYVKLSLWAFVYGLKFMWPYLVGTFVVISAGVFVGARQIGGEALPVALMVIGVIPLAVGIVLNMTKFFLYKNIFFSKDELLARDAVRESIELGKTKNGEIWKIFVTLLLFIVILFVCSFIVNLAIATGFRLNLNDPSMAITIAGQILDSVIWGPIIMIILAKGYNKIR